MSRCLFLLLASVVAIATIRPAAQSNALFVFHSNPWLNLHHFARASARGGPAPIGLSEEESRQWAAGVEFYKPYAARDLLRDDGMVDSQRTPNPRGRKHEDENRSGVAQANDAAEEGIVDASSGPPELARCPQPARDLIPTGEG